MMARKVGQMAELRKAPSRRPPVTAQETNDPFVMKNTRNPTAAEATRHNLQSAAVASF